MKEEQGEAKNKTETEPTIEAEEASEVVGDLKDENKVEEADSPPKTMKKRCKKKNLQRVVEKKIFLKEEGMKNLKFNVTIARSMIIMPQNAGIMPLTILKEKAIT